MKAAAVIRLLFNMPDGDVEIEITEEEARDLYDFLDGLFDKKGTTISWPLDNTKYKELDKLTEGIKEWPYWTPDTGKGPYDDPNYPMITWCSSNVKTES